ncbi:MAG: protein-(glutamine-N5) methyltransferase, release factor-specific [Candidatus Omnitrophica bacterium CG11_big_fil_rev_8_21_14_0_20_41_12]|nr:MAG: protein-(glutamine-N5) methyltransferase, release factor-specific [Candidatus Omnitrophica bacterium CG11_big_fil_rev_8_21_14_0_20_41_12]
MNEAELVLSHVLNCDKLSLYLNKDINLTKGNSVLISEILKRRISGEPLQYILGKTEFMGLEFKVDKRALIPRPETEILVETAINELRTAGISCPKIFDLGTGSGCIAISIAKLLPGAIIWAADISKEALQLAAANAESNKAEIKFLRSDIFSALELKNEQFDLIISNPPYVAVSELSSLAKEISFEPRCALAAGIEGLDFYALISAQAQVYLKIGGILAFEVGVNQSQQVCAMLFKENFSDIKTIKDYNNINRVVMGRKNL